MTAGTLRQRVTLQELQAGQDAIGAPSQVWADTAVTWADVQYQSGLSAIKAGADVSLSRVSIRLRYRAVSAGQRVVHGETVFNIQAVLPDARRVFVDLVCEIQSSQIAAAPVVAVGNELQIDGAQVLVDGAQILFA